MSQNKRAELVMVTIYFVINEPGQIGKKIACFIYDNWHNK